MRAKMADFGLPVLSVTLFLAALGMVFLYAPREVTMGDVQRIFYFHVASAWVGFFGFLVTFCGSAVYLARRARGAHGARAWDILALASAEVGLAFITMTVLTGMLWAKPVWGVYWIWEPRLAISAVQWLLYVAYVMLRGSLDNPDRSARFAAVYGIAAFMTVPLSWFAIRWWRTIHPQLFSGGEMAITPPMLATLLVSLIAFTVLYMALLRARMQLERERDLLAAARAAKE